ncbi:MAG: GldG family protein, partial [Puniceicoccales bacterium]|nr:GldG family protein [Puniceicoccales bacterium]
MANFRTSNRIKALCFLLCVSLAVAAYVVANVLASKHFFRKAFGTTPGLVLGEESRNILAQLKSDVEIFVLLEKTEAYADDMFELIKRDVRHLMNEYVQSATGHRIKIDVIDVSEYPKRHADLCGRFGVLPLNCVIIATNGAVRVLAVDELYEVKRGKAVAFRGERVITSAIGKLIDDKPSIIYFIHGHGEYELGDVSRSRGLSSMENFAKQKNCEMRSINLCDTKCIPSDADLVVIVGARSKFLGFEEEILRDFIDNGQGKLVVALDGIFDIGLRDF